jgi:hypothetical protein
MKHGSTRSNDPPVVPREGSTRPSAFAILAISALDRFVTAGLLVSGLLAKAEPTRDRGRALRLLDSVRVRLSPLMLDAQLA